MVSTHVFPGRGCFSVMVMNIQAKQILILAMVMVAGVVVGLREEDVFQCSHGQELADTSARQGSSPDGGNAVPVSEAN